MSDYFYKEHPKSCDPDDFWGQVKRTVDGKPVSQEQIDMIVAAVNDGLEIGRDDVLLDLCCGNGALTAYFFQRCAGGVGVDFSDYLVDVAKRRFSTRPQEEFVLGDVLEVRALVRGAGAVHPGGVLRRFMFLPAAGAAELLGLLRRRFTSLARLYIGNLPDKARMAGFYREGQSQPGMEDDPASPTGIWRTEEEFARLAAGQGWKASIRRMPPDFYAAHYRYDAVLVPAG